MLSRPPRLLIATSSGGKLREWRNLLFDPALELVTLSDVGIGFDVDETGATFEENAMLKAEAYGLASGLLTLAEDSGLEVAALGGAPGVQSARWEGDDYAHKNALLIKLLHGKKGSERACSYECVAVLRHSDGRSWLAHGSLHGEIATAPSGTGGFGYDPIFYVPELGKTLAEISVNEKDRISHRGVAARHVRPVLRRLLESSGAEETGEPLG